MIGEYLKKQGYSTIDSKFYTYIDNWKSWYEGDVKSFHNYKVYNGSGHIKCKRNSLCMGKKVCEDWANLLMNERVIISIDDEVTQSFITDVFNDNNFWVKINEMQEYKSALGSAAYIPYVTGITINNKTGSILNNGNIKLNYITAESIFPISWDNGVINECAFASNEMVDGIKYLYLQMHVLENGFYVIRNKFFKVTNESMQEIIDYSQIEKFKNIASEIKTNSDKKLFVIDRLNISNNIDKDNPLGISVFANSIDILKGVDLVYDSYNNEFVLGKKRIMVSAEATNFSDGEPTFDPNDVLFYQIPLDIGDKEKAIIQPIDMSLRVTEHEQGLQNRLNLLSSKCGFGENHYQFDRGNVTTATQIISENSTLFRVLKKHEIILEDVITELIKIIIYIGKNILKQPLKEDAEITIDFDDSIIEDKTAIKAQAALEYQQGLIDKVEYFVKVYNMSEEVAVEKVKKMEARIPKEDGKDWFPKGDE